MADLLMKMPFQYEPKKSNRFILSFPSSLGINSWYVEKASRPSIKIDTKEIKFLNTQTSNIPFSNSAIYQTNAQFSLFPFSGKTRRTMNLPTLQTVVPKQSVAIQPIQHLLKLIRLMILQ